MSVHLGPAPCHACGIPLHWDGTAWRENGIKHHCRRPLCMTGHEWEAWAEARALTIRGPMSPCGDCLPQFAHEMKRIGACSGVPGRRMLPTFARPKVYATEAERIEARRRTWRESAARRRRAGVAA